MGVSLERVQFKFASIIGELCSQPDVLSQFAVWLDLRLAEYKLKGAISLDCSGEEPNPVWLKGLSKQKSTPEVNNETDRRTQSRIPAAAYRNSSLHRPAHPSSDSDITLSRSHAVPSDELAERLSPDIFVVKDEPDVYPVSMHAHENRKRSATDTDSVDFRDLAKQRRPMSTTESPSHQSLMSVIGGFENLNEETFSIGDNSGVGSEGGEVADMSMDLPVEPSDLNVPNMQWLTEATASMTQPGVKALTGTSGSGNEFNRRKLSNAEKQKLYREKKKLIMTEEERERAKRMSQERYRRWKARNSDKFKRRTH